MVVIEPSKYAANLGVSERVRAMEGGDAASESLTDMKMRGFPGNFLTGTDEPAHYPRNGPFICFYCRAYMNLDAPGEVETQLDGRMDPCDDSDYRHFSETLSS